MFLLTYNYSKSIHHGQKLLDFENCAPTTRYNVHMYLAESKCMIGQFQDALKHIDQAEKLSEGGEGDKIQSLVTKVEQNFRKITVSDSGDEVINLKIINKLNKCVVDLCQGQFEKARQKFDDVVSQPLSQGGLGLKEVTCETTTAHMLPSYLVSLLSYFYLRVKNFKMARAVVKSGRFVVDTDHIVQQVKPNANAQQPPAGKYSKKQPA